MTLVLQSSNQARNMGIFNNTLLTLFRCDRGILPAAHVLKVNYLPRHCHQDHSRKINPRAHSVEPACASVGLRLMKEVYMVQAACVYLDQMVG